MTTHSHLDLPVGRYRLNFTTQTPLSLPAYSGSAWRGVFGRALRETACVTGAKSCDGCMLLRSCSYPYLFETPPLPDQGVLAGSKSAPHPYVLRPSSDRELEPGQPLSIELLLFGTGNHYLPYAVHALKQAGHAGLGRRRGQLTLHSVQQQVDGQWSEIHSAALPLTPHTATPISIPAVPSVARITLHTPLRMRRKNIYITPERFAFSDLFNGLTLRISQLTLRHTGSQPDVDYTWLASLARVQDVLEPSLRWFDWGRYSQRQQASMKMGGIIGEFSLEGEHLAQFWPWLWLGQYTHAGKACTMGLGQYSITTI